MLGEVAGCGLLLWLENKISIFFTVNGILMGQLHRASRANANFAGKQIPIDPPPRWIVFLQPFSCGTFLCRQILETIQVEALNMT
jgi:hypothetical protein